MISHRFIRNYEWYSDHTNIGQLYLDTHMDVICTFHQGQSKEWLRRLVPLLLSKRTEAQSLAAFHFAMEAGIKLGQGHKEVVRRGFFPHVKFVQKMFLEFDSQCSLF